MYTLSVVALLLCAGLVLAKNGDKKVCVCRNEGSDEYYLKKPGPDNKGRGQDRTCKNFPAQQNDKVLDINQDGKDVQLVLDYEFVFSDDECAGSADIGEDFLRELLKRRFRLGGYAGYGGGGWNAGVNFSWTF